jgi:2,3-bisphosphoglycerate-independent phosphoglycerate mutase
VVGPIAKALDDFDNYRLLVLPDHPTPLRIRTHNHDPVPFVVFGPGMTGHGGECFSEKSAEKTGLFIERGHELMEKFLAGDL